MDKSIPLILDSSIYKQMPKLNAGLLVELIKSVRAGIFKLYIPEIIEKEFLTWAQFEAQTSFNGIVKATDSLLKFYEPVSIMGIPFNYQPTAQVGLSYVNDVLRKVQGNWDGFKKNTDSFLMPTKPEHTRRVLDAYFMGEKPFSGIKNRNDIPDAFIFCCLEDLVGEYGNVIFVSKDKKFNALISDEKIHCYESLKDLFQNERYRLDSKFFKSIPHSSLITTLLKIYKEDIIGKSETEIAYSELLEETKDKLISNAVGEHEDTTTTVEALQLELTKVLNISEKSVLVPFNAILKYEVCSKATKEEAFFLSDERSKRIEKDVDDNGDFKLCEKYVSCASGHISVNFEHLEPERWTMKSAFKWAAPEIQEISVTLEKLNESN